VLPVAQRAGKVGSRLRFTGIAEITNPDSDPRPLHLIPVEVQPLP